MTSKKEEVYHRASRILHPREDRYMFFNESKRWEFADVHWEDSIKPLSQVYTEYRNKLPASYAHQPTSSPPTQPTQSLPSMKSTHYNYTISWENTEKDA